MVSTITHVSAQKDGQGPTVAQVSYQWKKSIIKAYLQYLETLLFRVMLRNIAFSNALRYPCNGMLTYMHDVVKCDVDAL